MTVNTKSKVALAGRRGARQKALRRFFRNPLSVVGLILVGVLLFAAIFAPLVSPHNPSEQSLFEKTRQTFR